MLIAAIGKNEVWVGRKDPASYRQEIMLFSLEKS